MDIIYILVPIAMLFVLVAVLIFLWAVKSEQFEDLNRQGMQILFEEDSSANFAEKQTLAVPPRRSQNLNTQHLNTQKQSITQPLDKQKTTQQKNSKVQHPHPNQANHDSF
ncbi:MAG: cbb3-type cytochrome oxidase assembly protein CcoS [Plesiomonas sp.]